MAADRPDSPAFPPSLQLLIAAFTSADRKPALAAVPMSETDWAALVAAAHRHGLSAKIGPSLADRSDTPAAVLAGLTIRAQEHAVRSLQGVSELMRIVRAFDESRVPVVVLKGPAFSQWLYGTSAPVAFVISTFSSCLPISRARSVSSTRLDTSCRRACP